jgi:hypothetical protein
MTAIEEIWSQLPKIQRFGSGLVGVFGKSTLAMMLLIIVLSEIEADGSPLSTAGGTSGIGESTAREFVRYAISPWVYLIGRSEEAATSIQEEFHELNPTSEVRFMKADASQLRNVDAVCQQIKAQESKINLLFLSVGIFHFRGREGM